MTDKQKSMPGNAETHQAVNALMHTNQLEQLLLCEDLRKDVQQKLFSFLGLDQQMAEYVLVSIRPLDVNAYLSLTYQTPMVDKQRFFAHLVELVTDQLHDGNIVFGRMRESYVMLLGFPTIGNIPCLQDLFAHILEEEVAPLGITALATIGSSYTSLENLYGMYQETLQLESYRKFLLLEMPVLSASELYLAGPQRQQQLQKLRIEALESIRKSEYEKSKAALKEFVNAQFSIGAVMPGLLRMVVDRFATDYIKACDEGLLTTGRRIPQEKFLMRLDGAATKQKYLQILLEMLHFKEELQKNSYGQRPAWLDEAIAYIEGNYMDVDLNASSLSDYVGRSLSHVSRSFQHEFNCGPYEYVQRVRCNAVDHLLRRGMTINEIARQTGFPSVQAMNRAYRKYRGIFPGRINTL